MASIVIATRKRVKSYLKEIYGKNYKNNVQEVDDSFVIRHGSAAVNIFVRPLSKDDCLVTSQAYVVQGAKIGPKILGMLMRLNATNPIGAFGLLFDDTIVFRHSISGANLDLNELRTSIRTVAFFADEYDDDILKIAGGFRAVDAQPLIAGDAQPAAKTSGKKAAPKKAAPKKAPVKTAAKKKK
ncbi:MAG: YbjN domain-containing protein [Bacteroidetes bacterium]|nr:YbjN domain-containing protein [Bacteroidota bacterium]